MNLSPIQLVLTIPLSINDNIGYFKVMPAILYLAGVFLQMLIALYDLKYCLLKESLK